MSTVLTGKLSEIESRRSALEASLRELALEQAKVAQEAADEAKRQAMQTFSLAGVKKRKARVARKEAIEAAVGETDRGTRNISRSVSFDPDMLLRIEEERERLGIDRSRYLHIVCEHVMGVRDHPELNSVAGRTQPGA